MHRLTPLAAVLLGLGSVVAQDAKPAKADTVSPAAALLAEHEQATTEYRARLSALAKTDDYQAALKAPRDRAKLTELRSGVAPVDTASFIERFEEGAAEHKGTEHAVDYLVWLTSNNTDKDSVHGYVDALLGEHIKSPKLEAFAKRAFVLRRHYDAAKAKDLLVTLFDQSPHAMVRAHAAYMLNMTVSRDKNATDTDRQQVAKMMAEAEKLAEGTTLGLRIQGPRFQKERLQIGMVAPDIEGEDLDGVPFKLSDYRGKVVVLDFWGDW